MKQRLHLLMEGAMVSGDIEFSGFHFSVFACVYMLHQVSVITYFLVITLWNTESLFRCILRFRCY